MDLGRLSNGLYVLRSKHYSSGHLVSGDNIFLSSTENTSNSFPIHSMSNSVDPCQNVWHIRLGHMPITSMKNIISLPHFALNKATIRCTIFPSARQHKLPFPNSYISSTKVFELIHIDTWGPYKTTTYDGFKYFLIIVDNFSRGKWTYLLSAKGNAFTILKYFISMVERQFNTKIKKVRSDNALEGSSISTTAYFLSKWIIHQTSCVATP